MNTYWAWTLAMLVAMIEEPSSEGRASPSALTSSSNAFSPPPAASRTNVGGGGLGSADSTRWQAFRLSFRARWRDSSRDFVLEGIGL
jgi:hypothetical protein